MIASRLKVRKYESSYMLLSAIFSNLSNKRKYHLLAALVIMILSGISEFLTLAAFAPFITSITEPERLLNYAVVQEFLKDSSPLKVEDIAIISIFTFGLLALISGIIRIVNNWVNENLAAAIGTDFSCEAYLKTLCQPYEVHVSRSSSYVVNTITNELDNTVILINMIMQLTTSFLVILGLYIALILVNSLIVIAFSLLFIVAYCVIAFFSKRSFNRNSYIVSESRERHLKALREGLGSIRDVLINGTQIFHLNHYKKIDLPMRRAQAQSNILSYSPKLALEAIGIFAISFSSLLIHYQNASFIEFLPMLGTLAIGSQKLLPALQACYNAWGCINSRKISIINILDLLEQPLGSIYDRTKVGNFSIKENIRIENLSFSYASSDKEVLKGIDFEITKGQRVAIIGKNGSGKSTLMDLLMGLLRPSKGKIFINDMDLNHHKNFELLKAWQSSIAHVPQIIYLSDSTIAENIAFGIPKKSIDIDEVIKASKQARIDEFINSLPYGYETIVGEDGARLSGGQRQRLAIARALYKQAQILFLDEVTSALDNQTEASIIKSICELDKNLTVVFITHRKSSMDICDRIIELEDGYLKPAVS